MFIYIVKECIFIYKIISKSKLHEQREKMEEERGPSNAIPKELFGLLALPDELSRLDLLGLTLRPHHPSGAATIAVRSRVRDFEFANLTRRR